MADARQALETLLESLGESCKFVTSGNLTPVLPGLDVQGVGSIGVPVSAADAERLIAQATQAPYGRGEATIVDTDVRRVWQIEPSLFAFRNAEWNTHVASIVAAVKLEFGIGEEVSHQLYKLLVYEKGSFFAPHRDSEKTPGMFATLVVCLPSRHEGGTLIVNHDGQTKKIDFGGADSEFKTHYAAFYADCQHEITPVTDGYRTSLVYNLAIAGRMQQPSAPQNAPAVEKAAQLLKELFGDASSDLSKIAIPFEHQYTEAGLDPRQLKGSDRARVDVLARAAEAIDYQCHLALLTHHQSGEADYSTWDPGEHRGRRSYRWSRDEDADDENSDDSGVGMGEVYEEELSLDHWVDPHGNKQPFGEMNLDESEILSQEGKDDWSYRQEVHEATGNEGVSMERWYRQGVVVIWPRDRYFRILADEGQASAVPALEQMAADTKKLSAAAECRAFAEEIIGNWKPRQRIGGESCSGRMLKLLEHIGDPELAQRFIRDLLPKDFDGSEGHALHQLCRRFGWQPLAAELRNFISQQTPEAHGTQLEHIVSICEPLCCDSPELMDERRAVCAALADELAQLVERWDAAPTDAWYGREEKRAGVVASVFRIFSAVSATERLDRFLAHMLADQRHYDLRESIIPGVRAIHEWIANRPAAQPAASRLLQHCLTELRAATAQPIEPPKDWTRDAELACQCEDCLALSRFLCDPARQVGRFSVRKDRRQHLHQQIDRHHCDLTHVTERSGSPQTLVCTKTQASYERTLKQFDVDTKLLAELEAFAGGQRAAVKRSAGRRTSKG
ncbi:MAG TPA: 2OG-Fe(II) oxygenase [Pirellulales bacterium]|nr:2OG-Fe(II) oxygenase [Pirellulales bacterium]